MISVDSFLLCVGLPPISCALLPTAAATPMQLWTEGQPVSSVATPFAQLAIAALDHQQILLENPC